MSLKINNKKCFPYDFVFVFGLIALGLFVYNKPPFALDVNWVSVGSKNTNFKTFSDKTAYEKVINLQKAFVENAKNVGPSVVNISHLKEIKKQSNQDLELNNGGNPWFPSIQKWFNKNFYRMKYLSETIGSGIILNNSGFILTNYHVIENKNKILIRLSDERDYFASIIGADHKTDLAVLKINSFSKLPTPTFDLDHKVEVGQWVMAIGNPYGLQGTVTVGIVSGVGKTHMEIGKYENYIQTDASINPGNSGGPLINLDGNIIGINTSQLSHQPSMGFAIPIKFVMETIEKLIKYGEIERGWLGAEIQGISPQLAELFRAPNTIKGILINKVENNTPAKIGGLLPGDIITQYDGKQVLEVTDFKRMITDTQVGKKVIFKVLRDGIKETLTVTIGKIKSY